MTVRLPLRRALQSGMRPRGLLSFVIAVLVGCGSTGAGASRPTASGADIGSPPGGNGNHVALIDEAVSIDAGAPSTIADEIIVSGRGFTGQPIVRTGTAGSVDTTVAREGASLDPSCVGTFPPRPQHVIKLGGRLDLLRVLVDTPGSDLTLAVRTPDGVWHCNDDSSDPGNALNPTVELYAPPIGEIEVYVGTYSPYYAGAQYTLGVSERPGYASELLRH